MILTVYYIGPAYIYVGIYSIDANNIIGNFIGLESFLSRFEVNLVCCGSAHDGNLNWNHDCFIGRQGRVDEGASHIKKLLT